MRCLGIDVNDPRDVLAAAAADLLQRRASGAALRVGLVGVMTALLLRWTGLAWEPTASAASLGAATMHLSELGVLAGGFFWGGVALLWWAAGRPQGSETVIFTLLSRLSKKFRKEAYGIGSR